MEPFIRLMLCCEAVRRRKSNPRKIDVYGLLTRIIPSEGGFPVRLSFCVYLVLTEGRGKGVGQILVVDADTETEVYVGAEHAMRFGSEPNQVVGVAFYVASCIFSKPGLYWVVFRYNGKDISRQPLLVEETP
jgi:hypothetical protein